MTLNAIRFPASSSAHSGSGAGGIDPYDAAMRLLDRRMAVLDEMLAIEEAKPHPSHDVRGRLLHQQLTIAREQVALRPGDMSRIREILKGTMRG